MRPLKLYIATSLDGYIATADGSVEWLDAYQSDEEDYGYHRFYDSVDTLLRWETDVGAFTLHSSSNFRAVRDYQSRYLDVCPAA